MQAWLQECLSSDTTVVTANRRLARALRDQFATLALKSGQSAWRSPDILTITAWQSRALDGDLAAPSARRRISSAQSRLLWEHCVAGAVDDPLINTAALVDACQEGWALCHQWQVPLETCLAASKNRDQRLFAEVALTYAARLSEAGWLDSAQVESQVAAAIVSGTIPVPDRLILAGFDRMTPAQKSWIEALTTAGCVVDFAPASDPATRMTGRRFARPEAEYEAAGEWARDCADRDFSVAIVVPGLEQDAQRAGRCIAQGMLPGWQTASDAQLDFVDVSYGQSLSSYPAIDLALLALKWLFAPLTTSEISRLLLSPLVDRVTLDLRANLDLGLRQLPHRSWRLGAFCDHFLVTDDEAAPAWSALTEFRAFEVAGSETRRPQAWATQFASALTALQWPGAEHPDSAEYQLLNRWQELLFETAQLGLVQPQTTMQDCWRFIARQAQSVLYQPESAQPGVPVMGPLEAAGLQFDAIWITGMTADQWPPARRPSALIARDLQREAGMPDCTPNDTLDYARRVIDRLARSADQVVYSFSELDDDVEQAPTGLLQPYGLIFEPVEEGSGPQTSVWAQNARPVTQAADPVPPLGTEETLRGGAGTVAMQLSDPFAAFCKGRLAIERIGPHEHGLSAALRGTQLHSAAQHLYADCPSQAEIQNWSEDALDGRLSSSSRKAIWRALQHADPVVEALLQLERSRITERLQEVVELDRSRDAFDVQAVEQAIETQIAKVPVRFRIDRLDRTPEGALWILDYKTGKRRSLYYNGELNDYQLAVYACAVDQPVDGLALFHVNAKQTDLTGISRDSLEDWDAQLAEWRNDVFHACQRLAAGDVRIGHLYRREDRQPWGLLSRVQELLDND